MKKLLALVPVLFLAGCNTPELVKPEYKVVDASRQHVCLSY